MRLGVDGILMGFLGSLLFGVNGRRDGIGRAWGFGCTGMIGLGLRDQAFVALGGGKIGEVRRL